MLFSARVWHSGTKQEVSVCTEGKTQSLDVPARPNGRGSSVNGGELLMLALATCYTNDVYREAGRLGIPVDAVEVEAEADFEGIGVAAKNIRYRVRVTSSAPPEDIARLLSETDAVAEIQNTVRSGVAVHLEEWSEDSGAYGRASVAT
jgi:organic hydroperoxide reductase OsmC/OhrA